MARGDDGRTFPWGHEQPNVALARFESGWNQTVPVSSYSSHSSPYGVIGMAGNALCCLELGPIRRGEAVGYIVELENGFKI